MSAVRFYWYDLLAADPDGAATFYEAVLGWAFERPGDGSWRVAKAAGRRVAGLVPVGDGADPHWLGHLAVDDVDTLARRTAFLQGQVLVEPEDLEGLGRGALLADPSGAVFHPFTFTDPTDAPTAPDTPLPGVVAWSALATDRPDLAGKAYKQLLGLKPGRTTRLPHGEYLVMKDGTRRAAGAFTPDPAADLPSQWVHHVAVPDLDAALATAVELGATPLHEPVTLKRVGRVVALRDPWGAAFGLFAVD